MKIRLNSGTGTFVIFGLGYNNWFLFQNTTLTVYLYVAPENTLLCSYAGVKEHFISLIFSKTQLPSLGLSFHMVGGIKYIL
jgi:hypothetical protein